MDLKKQKQEKVILGKTSSKLPNIVNNAKISNTSKSKEINGFEVRFFNENSGILYVYILKNKWLNENQHVYMNNLIVEKEKIINS